MLVRASTLARAAPRSATLVPSSFTAAKRFYPSVPKIDDVNADKVKNITVFGAGLMGSGIAQVAATNGYKVGTLVVQVDGG